MTTQTSQRAAHRSVELAHRFGDPYAPDNPVGFRAILDADERSEMCAAGEELLGDYGLNAEFVPPEHGGRFARLDDLVEVMRTVYRRDPNLGLGYGASSLISSVNAWAMGDLEQQRRVAHILLNNGRIAAAYHELAHGNDMASTALAATPNEHGWSINGRKEVVTNLQRADAVMLFTRIADGVGRRNHSQFLVDKSLIPSGSIHYLPRYTTVGLRGVQLGGAEFRNCPVTSQDMLGRPGQGLETAMRSFQITRTVLPAMMTGILDTALLSSLRHALHRRLYGGSIADLPHVRSILVGAFTDLLMCEAISTVAMRSIHLFPSQSSMYAATVKSTVAGALMGAVDRLSTVLGAEFFMRSNSEPIFQKMLRDLKPVGFGHAARAACQTTVLPHVGLFHRRAESVPENAAALFRVNDPLPPVPFTELSLGSRGHDPLAGALTSLTSDLAGVDAAIREHAEFFATELQQVREQGALLAPHELSLTASPEAYALVRRYMDVLVATSCLGVWLHNQHETDSFMRKPEWLLAALTRLRSGWETSNRSLPEELEKRLFTELLERGEDHRSFGLLGRSLRGVH